jgi:dTDP-4-dehydrorhamnose reductase
MKFVVTGVNGLVGSRLAPLLVAKGHTVTGLGRGPRRAVGAFDYRTVSLGDEDALADILRLANPEVVINLAAVTDVDACERVPMEAFRTNAVAPAVLALASSGSGAHLIHVSTDYVFDGLAGPYDEEAIPNPAGRYALTKHMGEQAVRALGADWTIARTAAVYGWPPAGRPNFGSWLLTELRAGRPTRLFQDQIVSPSLAESVAEQLAELAQRRLTGIWNIAGAEAVSRVRFGEVLCDEFALDRSLIIPSRLAEANFASPRPVRCGLRTDKAQSQLESQPLRLEAALKRFHRLTDAAQTGPTNGGARL